MELIFVLLLVFALLALVGRAADSVSDVDEDVETWLVAPSLVPWLPDYSDDK